MRKRFPHLGRATRASISTAAFLSVFLPLRHYPGRYDVLEVLYPVLSERAAFELRIERHGARLMSVPAIRQRLESAPSKEAALQMGQLTAQGLRRLDDATLLRRAVLLSGMFATLNEVQCAALARGIAIENTLQLALRDPTALDAWLDVTLKAALAEVEGHPIRALSEAEIDQAVAAMRRELPNGHADRVLGAVVQPAELPDRDLCWATRTLYQTATTMRDPDRAVLIRALVQ